MNKIKDFLQIILMLLVIALTAMLDYSLYKSFKEEVVEKPVEVNLNIKE